MRQSKHEYDQIIRGIEDRGAARERAKYQKAIDKAIGRIQDGVAGLLALLEQPQKKPQPQPTPKKRKAVEASADCVQAVLDVFECVPANTILLPKNMRVDFGPKIKAAACRQLFMAGTLIKVGAKGYRLAQGKENGLDATREA